MKTNNKLATRISSRPNDEALRGFSLIELLVVIFIMGLMIGLVSLSIGGDGPAERLRNTAGSLSEVMRLASEDAVLSGRAIGFTFQPAVLDEAWSFYWLALSEEGVWERLDAPLQEQNLPMGISLDLQLDGERFDSTAPKLANETPVLVFYPSGESQSFILTLHHADFDQGDQHIGSSLAGQILWKERPRAQ